jgi:hypothetical protein
MVIKKEDIWDLEFYDPKFNPFLNTTVLYDPSKIVRIKPVISEVDLPSEEEIEEIVKSYFISCDGCGASRLKGNECEYCGRKH